MTDDSQEGWEAGLEGVQTPKPSGKGITRKQAILLVIINAVISTVISVAVVLIVLRNEPVELAFLPTAEATAPAIAVEQAPTPTTDLVIHIVQSGDTISGLAFRYDVAGEDIIAANQIENPNFLQVGMQLIIPVGGIPEATATFTPEPTPTDTPIPFEPPSADMTATANALLAPTEGALPTTPPEPGQPQIEITEIIEAGDAMQGRVVIVNASDQVVDMLGWTLSDGKGNSYTFPNFRLWGSGSVIVHTGVGQDGSPPANFYWGRLEPVWVLGEMATLSDSLGQVVSTMMVAP